MRFNHGPHSITVIAGYAVSFDSCPTPFTPGLPPPNLIGTAKTPFLEGLAAVTTISPPFLFEFIAVLAGGIHKAGHGKIISVG